MYFRLKNKMDLDILKECDIEIDEDVLGRVTNAINILDENYGPMRTSGGGYVFFFTDIDSYKRAETQIFSFLRTTREDHEYLEVIKKISTCGVDIEWVEELFLLSSEDSILMIYPR